MKKGSIIFLQTILILIGIGALVFLLGEPHFEGRNVHATLFDIYFKDPFLAYAYIGSVSFFVALYQAFKLLAFIGQNKVFTLESVKALRTIKYCAICLMVFILGAEVYIGTVVRGTDDIAGGVAIGLMLMFVSAIIATAAAVFEKLLQTAVDIKSENDLTI